jgi:hypothetical protein
MYLNTKTECINKENGRHMYHGWERSKTHTYSTEARTEILGDVGVNAAIGFIKIEKTIDQLDYYQLLRIFAAA